jgi:hypothetical protein
LLNSDVAPVLDVRVAVKEGGMAECSVTGIATEKAANPVASVAMGVSLRKISPSAPSA